MTRNMLVTLGLLLLCSLGCDRKRESQIANVPVAQEATDRVAVDRLNREVRFKATPQRIISLMPAATELMYAIGAGPQLVGVTKNCNYPPEAETLERVGGGTMESISREKIVSLKPDLVLCKWDHHQPLMETLEQFNIPALAIGPETLEQLFAETTMLGDVTGHAEEATQLIAAMRLRVEKINARVDAIPLSQRRKVFYEVWDDPLMTAGPGSFIGEALRLAGMENIFEDATAAYPKVSDEVVVARNPDVIFSPSTHASRVSLEKMLQRQGWGEVTAIKQKQVFIVDGDHISRCGPRLLDAIEEMISLAYPEVGVQPLGARYRNIRTSYKSLGQQFAALPSGGPYVLAERLKPVHQRITDTKP
ncbi:MAG TPA: cobalamin-binding protein [Planctomycetaceae bacterium]|nr:cobalamin-binding protein [Planctomycetaceae bacterium]